jgi:hypothetical protein
MLVSAPNAVSPDNGKQWLWCAGTTGHLSVAFKRLAQFDQVPGENNSKKIRHTGRCRECNRQAPVKKNGKMYSHKNMYGTTCEGSNTWPKSVRVVCLCGAMTNYTPITMRLDGHRVKHSRDICPFSGRAAIFDDNGMLVGAQ